MDLKKIKLKMTTKYFAITVFCLGLFSATFSQKESEMFSIYLIRHAEKEADGSNDPSLTPCGQKRAESLKTFFQDVKLDAVYSTKYQRTINTALPTSISKGLDIIEYDLDNLVPISTLLLNEKKNALVVGHSNTTAVLAGLLIGEQMYEFDVTIYDRIYQVVISKEAGMVQIFHSNFECK
ncbi:MAG: histidine phosphatase family protein [Flavobacteriia bacterium]|nr:histidine phosphatase family protein [Flavobacteriia bacterium]